MSWAARVTALHFTVPPSAAWPTYSTDQRSQQGLGSHPGPLRPPPPPICGHQGSGSEVKRSRSVVIYQLEGRERKVSERRGRAAFNRAADVHFQTIIVTLDGWGACWQEANVFSKNIASKKVWSDCGQRCCFLLGCTLSDFCCDKGHL